ncbi:MAG: SDR family NAD(P)-dependent oxidoreductase [Caulobacteraceae bacterium]
MRFSGKKVLITGGSGAMGQRISAMIAAQGGEVTVIDLKAPAEGSARFIPGDLSSCDDLDRLAGDIAGEPWDILINLAGIQHFGPCEAQAPGHLYATYMINLVAPARLIQAVLPGMKARRSGQIANVGSIFGSINFAQFATYSSSKAGLQALSEALRRELEGSGVGVTYIATRAVRTPLNSEAVNAFAKLTGMNMDEPEAIAARIVEAIAADRRDVYLGFPESLFVKVNGVAPGLVDRALRANDLKARSLFAQ